MKLYTMFNKNGKNNDNSTSGISPLEVCNIAFGTSVEGNLKVKSNLRIEGTIHGSVTCSGRLVMSAKAEIEGDVSCESIICEGKIKGNIVAKERIHLQSTATVTGNIKYQSLQIDSGAIFNGHAVCSANNPNGVHKIEMADKVLGKDA